MPKRMPIKESERQLWVLGLCNGVQCEGKDARLGRRQNTNTQQCAKIKHNQFKQQHHCAGTPPSRDFLPLRILHRELALSPPVASSTLSPACVQSHFPPIINLNKIHKPLSGVPHLSPSLMFCNGKTFLHPCLPAGCPPGLLKKKDEAEKKKPLPRL